MSLLRPLFRMSAIALGAAAFGFAAEPAAELVVHADQSGPVINRNIYGQFSEHLGHCIYGGVWVGPDSKIPNTRGIRNDVVAALREIKVPVVRWPGGCFADEYHWKDGIGPMDKRPSMINTTWGGVVENNHFGTHEFMDFCKQVGCDAYVCGNLGSGTVQEMMEWVEYMCSDAQSPMANLRRANGDQEPFSQLKYFAVGNESWGCGGSMRPEYYADEYRRYNTFAKNYPGHPLLRYACGPSSDDYNWTEKVMAGAGDRIDGLSLHYYTLPNGDWSKPKGSATKFDEKDWFKTLHSTLFMDELIRKHLAIMDRYDPKHHVGLVVDEWGVWTDVEPGTNPGFLYQQNSLRDAVLAALNLHIFQAHADRVVMANIAQMVNVLQAMILTDGDKMVCTPTYYVFKMFVPHHDATVVPIDLKTPDYTMGVQSIPAVSASASRDASGKIHLSLVNTDPEKPVKISTRLAGRTFTSVSGQVLTAATITAHNTFEHPDVVKPVAFNGATLKGDSLEVEMPSKSVVMLELN